MSKTFTIKWTPEEEKLFKGYAKLTNTNLSTLFKDTLREYIEDQYDLQLIAEYEQSKKDGTLELVDWEDAWKEIGV